MKTAILQDNIYTTYADAINVTFNNSYLYVPIFIPSAETQVMFNESIKNNYTYLFDSLNTDRKVVIDGLEFQVDKISSKYYQSKISNSSSPNS